MTRVKCYGTGDDLITGNDVISDHIYRGHDHLFLARKRDEISALIVNFNFMKIASGLARKVECGGQIVALETNYLFLTNQFEKRRPLF